MSCHVVYQVLDVILVCCSAACAAQPRCSRNPIVAFIHLANLSRRGTYVKVVSLNGDNKSCARRSTVSG